MKRTACGIALALCLAAPVALAQDKGAGKAVYDKTCALCHGSGLAGAPRHGQAGEWAARLRAGMPKLYESALKGTPRGMPGRGGNMALSDAEVKAAVDYLVASVRQPTPPVATPARPLVAKVPAAPAPPTATPPTAALASAGDPNSFNRLLAAPGKRNPPPAQDGIHDAANPGTASLQPPLASFMTLPALNAGNRINWVKALAENRIKPRWDRSDAEAKAVIMDLNIVREVKGSMPDVVYPHKQHTEWLDCSACHPSIFIAQKGANQISMAAIMLGQKCGVCHGKVAFPVSECRLCHSRNKDASTRTAGAAK